MSDVMGAAKLINREQAFLDFLLDPTLFGERVPGPSRIDRQRLSQTIGLLQKLPQIASVVQATRVLREEQTRWEEEARLKRTQYVSRIQSSTRDGTENLELTERLFVATLIARKRGPKPYDFVHSRIQNPWCTPKAIEMRVRRFETALVPQGPRSCQVITRMKYVQFLCLRRAKGLKAVVLRYQKRKLSYKDYREQCNRLMMPTRRENVWLDSLCRYSRPVLCQAPCVPCEAPRTEPRS